jgi:hypothetical protein
MRRSKEFAAVPIWMEHNMVWVSKTCLAGVIFLAIERDDALAYGLQGIYHRNNKRQIVSVRL